MFTELIGIVEKPSGTVEHLFFQAKIIWGKYFNDWQLRYGVFGYCCGIDLFPKTPALPALCFKSAAPKYVWSTH
jgi:hypothetical protein